MFRFNHAAALVGAVMTLALTSGCGGNSTKAYVPNAVTAKDDLNTALTAWQKGGKPAELMKSEHPIYFVDSQWESGAALESFEILDEKPSTSPTEKRFGVTLKIKKPAAEKRLEYVAVGKSPMWIFSDEDYVKQGSMGEQPTTKPKAAPARKR